MSPNTTIRLLRVVLTLGLAACVPADVRTAIRPETDLRRYRSFDILEAPSPRGGPALDHAHPMRPGSSTNVELHNAIVAGLWNRGYWRDNHSPDLLVAYYASTQEPLDPTRWNYGYGWRTGWWPGCGGSADSTVMVFPPGTVIIDVLDGLTGGVLWRGCGVAHADPDLATYHERVRATVQALFHEFPQATTVVAGVELSPSPRPADVAAPR
jgi:hypothetical protein